MTGVGGRPEVIIEGSNDLDGPWRVQYRPFLSVTTNHTNFYLVGVFS